MSSQSYAASQSDGAFVQHQFQKELGAQSKSVKWTSQSSYLHHDLKGVRSSSLRGSLSPVREARFLFHSLGWVTAQLLWKFQVSNFLCSILRSRRRSWLSAAHSAPGAQVVSVSRGLGGFAGVKTCQSWCLSLLAETNKSNQKHPLHVPHLNKKI